MHRGLGSGQCAVGHVLLGAMVPFLGSAAGKALAFGFIAYQLTEREPWGDTFTDLGQFAAGYVGGEALAGVR